MAFAHGPEPAEEPGEPGTSEVREATAQESAAIASPSGFGRTLAGRATNLLASGLVMIAGLAAGREVLTWWHASPATPIDTKNLAESVEPNWNFDDGLFDVRFGDAPLTLRRQSVVGDASLALERLRGHTADLARQTLRDQSPTHVDSAESADSQWIQKLLDATPAAGEPGSWALHEWLAPLPRNVVISLSNRRIVAWGLAFPATDSEAKRPTWTLFSWTLHSSDSPRAAQASDATVPPRPPGAEPGLSLHATNGESLTTFQSRDSTARIERYFDEWARERKATCESDWRTVGDLRAARYRTVDGRRVTVQLHSRAGEDVRGIVTVTQEESRAEAQGTQPKSPKSYGKRDAAD